ncbi:MAG: hypothetical protein AVO33_07970 [delta proteobacterium ML8_F1]|nr:MAG: hypothetical protein AVO33_07970 [delta proteobacterium ML8_F1]
MTYLTILDELVQRIEKGGFKPQEPLPSENMLSQKYQVTRHCIRKVYERLSEMGYIKTEQGKGRWLKIQKQKIKTPARWGRSFQSEMEALSLPHETQNIDFEEVPGDSRLMAALGLSPRNRVYRITRLRLVDKEPVAAHITYLTDRDFPLIAEEGPGIHSITEYLESKNCAATVTTLEMATRLPTLKEQALLKCPSLVPVMKMETFFIKKADRTTIGYGEVVFRGDRFVQQIQP